MDTVEQHLPISAPTDPQSNGTDAFECSGSSNNKMFNYIKATNQALKKESDNENQKEEKEEKKIPKVKKQINSSSGSTSPKAPKGTSKQKELKLDQSALTDTKIKINILEPGYTRAKQDTEKDTIGLDKLTIQEMSSILVSKKLKKNAQKKGLFKQQVDISCCGPSNSDNNKCRLI